MGGLTLGADLLLLLTDVPAVGSEWGTGFARSLRYATPAQLRTLSFPPESMGAKVSAAIRFVEANGPSSAPSPTPPASWTAGLALR